MPRKIHADPKGKKYKFGGRFGVPYITDDYKVYRNKESIPYLTRDKQVPYKVCEDFVDPISLQYFTDPVLAADDKIYERVEIQIWLLTSNRSPLTRELIAGPGVRGLMNLPRLQERMNTIKAMCPPISHGRGGRGDIKTWADAERVVQTNQIAQQAVRAANARQIRQRWQNLLRGKDRYLEHRRARRLRINTEIARRQAEAQAATARYMRTILPNLPVRDVERLRASFLRNWRQRPHLHSSVRYFAAVGGMNVPGARMPEHMEEFREASAATDRFMRTIVPGLSREQVLGLRREFSRNWMQTPNLHHALRYQSAMQATRVAPELRIEAPAHPHV